VALALATSFPATCRPTPIDADTRALIRRMWKENPLWGEDLIAGELAKLGHDVSLRTVAKYRPANLPRGRGQKWSTFIRNHLGQTWAADWFTIVTMRFQVLYALVILDLPAIRSTASISDGGSRASVPDVW